MNFIKKIFEGKIDESVHLQFQKFSRGEFRDRALVRAKKSKENYTINTSAEFANDLVRTVAEELGDKKTKVIGCIVSTLDLKGKINFVEIKQFQGVKKYVIDYEMSGKEIIKLMNDFPKNFFALTFESDKSKLKIKPKAPKSAKPGSGKENDEGPKIDFCRLVTSDEKLGKSFVFDKPDFKEAEINHTYFIDKIIFPEGEKDYAVIREKSKRKGKILRKAKIDGQETKVEKEFEA
jgi:hypothetical protein